MDHIEIQLPSSLKDVEVIAPLLDIVRATTMSALLSHQAGELPADEVVSATREALKLLTLRSDQVVAILRECAKMTT